MPATPFLILAAVSPGSARGGTLWPCAGTGSRTHAYRPAGARYRLALKGACFGASASFGKGSRFAAIRGLEFSVSKSSEDRAIRKLRTYNEQSALVFSFSEKTKKHGLFVHKILCVLVRFG
jgi:hypothetical protein